MQLATSCSSTNNDEHSLPSKLTVGTVYSPSGFFILRGDTLGYDYDRICSFAKDKRITLEFKVASNLDALIAMLDAGTIDIIATEVPNSDLYRRKVINCGSINETHPVLVQHSGANQILDITQLSGKEVVVESKSKYEALLTNINSQLGGTIDIRTIPQDSVSTDDLMQMVSDNKISYTIVDSDIAQFNSSYYDSINVNLTMGATQMSSWAVSLDNKWLADSIDSWSNSINARTYSKAVLEKYVKKSRIDENDLSNELPQIGSRSTRRYTSNGSSHIPQSPSSFDELFRRYGGGIGWDWHLLSAIARVESNYNPNARSWAGAMGLMQVMPSTARGYGVNPEQLYTPEVNVRTAARFLHDVNSKLQGQITNRDERLKFVIAAYNAGLGHVLDAMALAQKHGKDPHVWYGNVEEAILWKSNPQYYNDPVCRYGYCRGRETVNYVRKVLRHR